MKPNQRKANNSTLKIAQAITNMIGKGIEVTPEEYQFSLDCAETYGEDAVWQQ